MARIGEAELERLKASVSVADLVAASGVVLARQGADLAGLCPFHEDREPSLKVTPAKNLWHCFGCGAGGGPIDWVMQRKGVSFRHAVELLRERHPSLAAGAADRRSQPTVRTLGRRRCRSTRTTRRCWSRWSTTTTRRLKQTPEALAYLEKRGIAASGELIEIFRLGFANRTLGLRLPEKNRKAGADMRARLERLGLYRESRARALQRLAGGPGLRRARRCAGMYGRKIAPTTCGPARRCICTCPARIAACGIWRARGRRGRGDPLRGADRRPDVLVRRLSNVTARYGVDGFTDDHLAALPAIRRESGC